MKQPKKKKTTRTKKLTTKEQATAKGEPYVEIIKVDLDPRNVRYGSFELDWNKFFVEELLKSGYRGPNDESIVDQWFQDVCRHIVLETFEQDAANTNPNNIHYINRNPRDDGKTEIS